MKIAGTVAVISSTLLLASCTSTKPPVVYTTPGGHVVSAPDPRTAADRALETTLRTELNRYGDLAAVNPDLRVDARNGTVTLTGPVRTEKERQVIHTLVRNTPGVTSINDQLRVTYSPTGVVVPPPASTSVPVYSPPPVIVSPGAFPRVDAATTSDEVLARRITDHFGTEKLPEEWLDDVTIQVKDGAAYVRGWVDTQQQREAIDAALQRVRGITSIYDQLQVR